MQNNSNETAKVALVTGAARRIGAVIARHLHANGFNVVVHYNKSTDEANKLCAELNASRPHSAAALQADLSQIQNLDALIKQSVNAWGRLDVLVNNASRFQRSPVGEVTEAIWDDLFNSNLKSAFFLSQAAAPHLARHKGKIINIADVHGERPMLDYSAYCISKAGLLMLTRSLAKELGPQNITVNAISPAGGIMLPEGDNEMSGEVKSKILSRIALERTGDPMDIAQAVLFFAKAADFVTGQVLAVDGGRSLTI